VTLSRGMRQLQVGRGRWARMDTNLRPHPHQGRALLTDYWPFRQTFRNRHSPRAGGRCDIPVGGIAATTVLGTRMVDAAEPHQSRCLVCCPMTDATSSMGRSAARRVWSRLPPGAQLVLEDGLSPTDLQSLLLDLVRTRAHHSTPSKRPPALATGPTRAAISHPPASAG
jgi:hypothetical protein